MLCHMTVEVDGVKWRTIDELARLSWRHRRNIAPTRRVGCCHPPQVRADRDYGPGTKLG